MTRTFRAGADDVGDRLDVALARWLDEPRNQAAARIERGEVTVATAPAAKSHRLVDGEEVIVAPPPRQPTGAAGVPAPPIRYEDEHLLVVAKPAGLVVHPGVGNPAGTLVQALAAAGYPLAPAGGEERPGIVHRLDRDTSGLLAIAKTDEAHAGLVHLLRRHDVDRRYLTLVEGRLPAATGRVEAAIGRDPGDRKRYAAVADGKPAVTHWRHLADGRAGDAVVSLVACRLETGRTHQIRVHLSYAGHPVVADRTYAASRAIAGRLELDRPFLHAAHLGFVHPVTGARVAIDEPLPDDLRDACGRAGIEPDRQVDVEQDPPDPGHPAG